ncbi:ankyrin [Thozetella sp. PMI_491]|nr:ankyrin [Thozetella sp. PMI_491]
MSVVEALERTPKEINDKDRTGTTPLHWAVRLKDMSLLRLLLAWKADTNVGNVRGQTPLFEAASHNQPDFAHELIDAGADVNASSKNGSTPLMLAVQQKSTTMVKYLLSVGAEPDATRFDGSTSLHLLTPSWEDPEDVVEIVEQLVAAGMNLDIQCNLGWTPLQWALRYDDERLVAALLRYGADLTVVDGAGSTIFHLAAIYCSKLTINLLGDALQLHMVDPDALDNSSMTAVDRFNERLLGRHQKGWVRKEASDEDFLAFQLLLGKIRLGYNASGDASDSEEEEFHDTVERLE